MKPAQEGFSGPFPKERIGCPLSRFTLFVQGRQKEKGKGGKAGRGGSDQIGRECILLVLVLLVLRRRKNYYQLSAIFWTKNTKYTFSCSSIFRHGGGGEVMEFRVCSLVEPSFHKWADAKNVPYRSFKSVPRANSKQREAVVY